MLDAFFKEGEGVVFTAILDLPHPVSPAIVTTERLATVHLINSFTTVTCHLRLTLLLSSL